MFELNVGFEAIKSIGLLVSSFWLLLAIAGSRI